MMNREDLKLKLDDLKVSPEFYSLEGNFLPDRIVLFHNYSKWEVCYFDERGNRDNEQIFSSENEACVFIYEYL
jgi:hypothetical protein